MDAKDQIVHNLTTEIELLKIENQYLKEQLLRINQGKPIEILDHLPLPNGKYKSLPPLNLTNVKEKEETQISEIPINKIVTEYQFEIHRLMNENQELRASQEAIERNYSSLIVDNSQIQNKLQNLEQVFLNDNENNGNKANGSTKSYMTSNLLSENSQLKNQVRSLEEKKQDMEEILRNRSNEKFLLSKII